ncbi:DUF4129 domain-containing protein [Sporolactobacillus pectinivorans]|uniref:DUF4129 domain-containing protein n=1 Tax=Sporolactobacillus pectinivorans TaxID=1591408 RepID=UPI000C264846|nr:DUF4129 domain-containing protein [Sporolactobacillus pectinivorans]
MTKMQPFLPLVLYSCFCLLFSYLVLFPLSPAKWAVFLPLAVLAVIQSTFMVSLFKWKKAALSNILILSVAIGLAAFLFFHILFLPSCLIAILFLYFSSIGLERRDAAHLWLLFLISASAAIYYYLFFPIGHRNFIFLVLLAELIVLNVLLVVENRSENRYMPGLTAMFIFAAAVLALIVSMLKPLFIWIYDLLFNVLLKNALYSIFNACWIFLNHFANSNRLIKPMKALQNSNANQESSNRTSHPIYPQHHYGLWIALALVTILVITFYLWLRKRKLRIADIKINASVSSAVQSDTFGEKKEKRQFFGHLLAPRDPVRKAIFYLQKIAEKAGSGRHFSESLTEWLQRLDHLPDQDLVRNYQKVRYGHQNLLPDEKKAFFDSVARLRKAIENSSHPT